MAQKNIHAYVSGEHGDSSFVPWSNADIASVDLDDYYAAMADKVGIEKLDKDAMEEYAVSYTHLDVYKRQAFLPCGFRWTL